MKRPRLGAWMAPLLLLGAAAGCGRDEDPAPGQEGGEPLLAYHVGPRAGRWHAPRAPRAPDADEALSAEQRAEMEDLESIGYAAGVHDATGLENVTRHDPERAFDGVNLYTPAHAATARLIDMRGEVLHEWRLPFEEVWPERARGNKLSTFWRRTHLFENGDLLAIYEGLGLIKVDRDSNLLWSSDVRAHHDLEVMADGTIWVLTREARVIPEISAERPVLEDFVSVFSAQGEELRRLSLLDALEGTELDRDWSEHIHLGGDLLHTNTLVVLDGRLAEANPAFRAGNLLLSSPLQDLVFVVDPDAGRAVWGEVGPYARQHDAQVLDSGVVMIFDNQGAGPETSRILELDPATWEPVWSFAGTPEQPFYSETCGLAQRLPNGNTLITESDFGRAFEITRDGDVVWEFYNPHRAGENGRYIATLMEMQRLPRAFPLDWARGR